MLTGIEFACKDHPWFRGAATESIGRGGETLEAPFLHEKGHSREARGIRWTSTPRRQIGWWKREKTGRMDTDEDEVDREAEEGVELKGGEGGEGGEGGGQG